MSGMGTKILLFALILSFSFRLWADTKISGVGSGSTTFDQAVAKDTGFIDKIKGGVGSLVRDNLATSTVSAIGIIFGNPFVAFAGIALMLFNQAAFPAALLNESIGGLTGTLLSNVISLLYAIAVLDWFAQRGDF